MLSWRLTGPVVNDTTQLVPLLQDVAAPIRELYADAGYFSKKNCDAARLAGATPYIRPRKNAKPAPPPPATGPDLRTAFQAMVGNCQSDPETWYGRYKRRNRIESTFGAIKRRFGGRLKAISQVMRLVEAGLKLLTWNLTRIRYGEF